MIRLFRADDHQLDEILFDLIPTWPIINQMNLDLRSRLSLHFTVETIWYFQMASNQKNLLKFADELVKGTDSTDASVTSMDQVYESFERLGLPSRKWSQHPAWWKEKSFTPKDFIIGKFLIREFFEVIRGLNWTDCGRKYYSWENGEIKKNFLQLDRYRQHELARQRLAAIKHIRFLFDSLDSNDEDKMFCGLTKILECEKERLRTIRSSDSSSGLSPFGSLRKYMKSNKTSCPTLNTLFRDPRTYKIQPDYFIIQ